MGTSPGTRLRIGTPANLHHLDSDAATKMGWEGDLNHRSLPPLVII